MTIKEISEFQRNLDMNILENHNLEEKDTLVKRILAFLVELGELANETRCFKYWSLKSASEKEVILDEYADGLHFLVSIGNTLGIELDDDIEDISCDLEINTLFIELFGLISLLYMDLDKSVYLQVFDLYYQLGFILGFSKEELYEAYSKKNKVNFERQKNNY